jgi:uncharacterized paraquat-inducible protein A
VRFDMKGNGEEATYPAMLVSDLDPQDVAEAILRAQAGLGAHSEPAQCLDCDAMLTPSESVLCCRCLDAIQRTVE